MFDYTIRERRDVKKVRMKVTVQNGLEVFVPRGFNHNYIDEIVNKQRQWIEEALDSVQEQQKFLKPENIFLVAIGEGREVEYWATSSLSVSIVERGDKLMVRGNIEDTRAVRSTLSRWQSRKAHAHLVSWLHEVGTEKKLPFGKVMVGGQKTRWASYSGHNTISINRNLLFLPDYLVRYAFAHELYHTLYLDHSLRFWTALKEGEPECKQLDEEIKQADCYVPEWALA